MSGKKNHLPAWAACLVFTISIPALASKAQLVEHPVTQWPEQDIRDISALQNLFITSSSFATGPIRRASGLQKCKLDDILSRQLIAPTDEHIHLKFRMLTPTNRHQIRSFKVTAYSSAEGCEALPSHINRDVLVPERLHALALATTFSFPIQVESDYRYTAWIYEKVPVHFRQRYVIERTATGLDTYPLADRIFSRTTYPGSLHSNVPLHVMNFHGSPQGQQELISLQRGQVGLLVSNNLYMVFRQGSDTLAYEWQPGGKVLSLRNNRLDGLMQLSQESDIRECYSNHERIEYFRITGIHTCEAVDASEAGRPGVHRDRIAILIEEQAKAAEQEAASTARQQHNTGTGGPAPEDNAENIAAACTKAYAAHRLCQTAPSDPFGVTRSFCINQVKKNFGGMGCPLPL